jgi:hypothetical protein
VISSTPSTPAAICASCTPARLTAAGSNAPARADGRTTGLAGVIGLPGPCLICRVAHRGGPLARVRCRHL